MFEELYAPIPDAGQYLARIGLDASRFSPTAQGLCDLVQAHLTHVLFESADIWANGAVPSLAVEDLFRKVVVERRGGFCFELNSLFCALLKALGYEAHLVIAHIVRGKDYLPIPTHCAVICTVDGMAYYCDVGYGGPAPFGPVACDGQFHHGFRIVSDGIYRVLETRREEGSPEAIIRYKDVPVQPVELIPLVFFASQQPGSPFRSGFVANIRLPGGSAAIRGGVFTLHDGSTHIERPVENRQDLKQLLSAYFHVDPEVLPMRD